jgi:glycerophosphoryl diester phosphodiesterase
LLIKELAPEATLSFLTQQDMIFNNVNPVVGNRWTAGHRVEDYENSVPKMISQLGGKIWCPIYSDLTPTLISEAHYYNLKVVPWTVDNPADMKRMISFGVDGIISNYPHLLRGIKIAQQVSN